MAKHRQIVYGARLPQSWLDAIQEFVGTYVSPNFKITQANATTIQVVAGADDDLVAIGIDAKWRYNVATTNRVVSGVAGDYDIFVVANPNSFTGGTPETDNTDYSFALRVLPAGNVPSGTGAETHYRKVGELDWNGSIITAVTQLAGVPSNEGAGLVAQQIGDGAAVQFDLAHNLGSRDVIVAVREVASPYQFVFPDVEALDANTVRLKFAVAPTLNQYQAIVIGGSNVTSIVATPHAASHHPQTGSDKIQMSLYTTAALRPLATAVSPGTIHRATDTGAVSQSDGAAWQQLVVPGLWGTLAARPAASAVADGVFYYVTDQGILYQEQADAWVKVATKNYADLDGIPSTFTPAAHAASHHPQTGADRITMSLFGTLAARPAATSVVSGTIYRATDTKLAYQSDGASTWALLADAPTTHNVRVRKSVVQSIADNSYQILSFDTEDYDTDGYHDNVTNNSRITIPSGQAGKYRLTAQLAFANPAENGVYGLEMNTLNAKHGIGAGGQIAKAEGSGRFLNISLEVDCAEGDAFYLGAFQTHSPSPGALNTAEPTWFAAEKIS